MKHNKKRNTAFLFEALVREITKAAFNKDTKRANQVRAIVKEFFSKGSVLQRELELYEALVQTEGLDIYTAEKLVHKVKEAHSKIDPKAVFNAQSKLISKINKTLTEAVYGNFVPNYKELATISMIFNDKNPVKTRVLLERELLKKLSGKQKKALQLEHVDSLVYKTFVENFNKQYQDLLDEQKELLNKYILSFDDDGTDLLVYVNEEIARIRTVLNESLKMKELQEDQTMTENMKQVIDRLEEFKEKRLDDDMLEELLRFQKLAREILD